MGSQAHPATGMGLQKKADGSLYETVVAAPGCGLGLTLVSRAGRQEEGLSTELRTVMISWSPLAPLHVPLIMFHHNDFQRTRLLLHLNLSKFLFWPTLT